MRLAAYVNPDAHVAPQVTTLLRFEVLGLCSAAWRKTRDTSMMQYARCTGGTLYGNVTQKLFVLTTVACSLYRFDTIMVLDHSRL